MVIRAWLTTQITGYRQKIINLFCRKLHKRVMTMHQQQNVKKKKTIPSDRILYKLSSGSDIWHQLFGIK